MRRHRILIRSSVLCAALLFITVQAQARVEPGVGTGTTKRVVLMNHDDLLKLAKSSGLKLHVVKFVKLSKDDLKRLATLPSKGCGCALPQDAEGGGGWRCFKGCMAEFGVNAMTLTACGVVCSVNLVGCAICVGVSEWIVAGCAMFCTWSPLLSKNDVPAFKIAPESRPVQTHKVLVAKRATVSR